MHPKKRLLLLIILVGGMAVLASYYFGLRSVTGNSDYLWGGIPTWARPYFTVTMLLGAAGFFAFSYHILFRLDTEQTRFFSRFGYRAFHWIYILILIPSALWLPLTLLAFAHSSALILWAARLDLAVVAVASLALLVILIEIRPRQSTLSSTLAIMGSVFFCIQTVPLDAIIWGILIRL